MIDTKNRLVKLVNQCTTYEQFEARSISKASWVLAPYVATGHIVTKAWLKEFFNNFKYINS